ncbi:MAG: polysaccharide deacetylase family protein [Candidatus Margulisiibacteriota bacterium]
MKNSFIILFVSAITLTVIACLPAFSSSTLSGQALWSKNTPKTIYLTFDDGPDPINTPIFLDILKKYNVKATFFVLGRKAEKNPAIIKRIKDEGHILGNHTFNHIDGTVKSKKTIERDLERTHNIIRQACGVNVTLFRPPYGYFDWRVYNAASDRGYQIVLWTFDVCDWEVYDPKEYLKTVNENLSDGAIILLHDGGPSREALIEALPQIIEQIKAKGFQFKNDI